jgi:hypothetical protein
MERVMENNDTFLLIKEAAEKFNKSEHMIRNLIHNKKVTSKKNNQNKLIISTNDLFKLYPKNTTGIPVVERLESEICFLKDQIKQKDEQIIFYQTQLEFMQTMFLKDKGASDT